jgi:antitoxin (DNA-binding transcriptional repressor) of toxin-antitoxin stability system
MREYAISVTMAARQFADCVNRVRYQGASFLLLKNGIPAARLVPADSASGTAEDQLAAALREARSGAPQGPEEAPKAPGNLEENRKSPQPPLPSKRPALNW